MKEMSIDRIIEKETKYFKEEQHKYDCYMDLSDEGKRTWSEGKQAKYEAEYHKVIIEAELSDSQVETLNNKNIDISEPFATNVTLDYGNEVVYCAGKVQSFYKPEKNQEYERE